MNNLSVAKRTIIGNSQTGHYYWVGLCGNGIDYYAGQTFKSDINGSLKSIQIFTEMIIGETDVLLSVFEFDEKERSWKEKKTESRLVLNQTMQQKWVEFKMNDMNLDNKKQYAFKISCNHGGMMAVAECPWKQKDPYPDGIQWIGSSENPEGRFHPNFDLAFIAEIETN